MWLLLEDLGLQPAQAGRRLEAELGPEVAAVVLVDAQGLALPAAAVEREHELGPGPLAQRVGRREGFELGHELRVVAQVEAGLAPVLEREAAQLLEPERLGAGELVVGELGVRRARARARAPRRAR